MGDSCCDRPRGVARVVTHRRCGLRTDLADEGHPARALAWWSRERA